MVIAEFQVGLALKGFASKLTVPNYRVKWGADFSPPKWMFCPKANAKHAQIWIFLGSNSLLGIHLSQQLKNFKIFYYLQSLREAFMKSICPKIGGLTVYSYSMPECDYAYHIQIRWIWLACTHSRVNQPLLYGIWNFVWPFNSYIYP